ncbi:hypothetical protein KKE06_01570 [Candidatus Micrarchaeota archaeon]|nr:hypothetical protein [Candidatus Micrarchaeota archaeon]MBU1930258.1 hypothetical protein [Candidatus Micrarchaeota archaeon]
MPVEFVPRPPKGLRKHFRKKPSQRKRWYQKKSKELPVQGRPYFIVSGEAAYNIRTNLRVAIQDKLKGFNPSIVETIMDINEAIITIRHDDAREYERVTINSHPHTISFNMIIAGRKGDTGAVRELARLYRAALKKGKKAKYLREGRDNPRIANMLKDVYKDIVSRAKDTKYIGEHPREFCKAVQLAFTIEFDPREDMEHPSKHN